MKDKIMTQKQKKAILIASKLLLENNIYLKEVQLKGGLIIMFEQKVEKDI